MKSAAVIAIGIGIVAVGLAAVFALRKFAKVGAPPASAVEDLQLEEEDAVV